MSDASWRPYVELFRCDALRWVRPQEIADADELDIKRLARLMLTHLPLRAMAWFRFGGWAHARKVPFVPGFVQRHLVRVYGLELSPSADVGGGLYIAHPVGCVIQAERIGENVTFIGPVTVGYRDSARWPRIDDEAYIGTGARILGGIELGAGCKVGANAVVLSDVAPKTTVVGSPARPVR
jgi:serine O-acetyltransferase